MQKENQYNQVTFCPYQIRRTLSKEKANIVLRGKHEVCDYLALGIYLLAKSIDKKDEEFCEEEKISVCYRKSSFKENSGCSLLVDGREIHVPEMALQGMLVKYGGKIINFMYGTKIMIADMLAIIMCPEFYGVSKGYYTNKELHSIIPFKFSMSDAESAQKFAYDFFCNRLEVYYPHPIEKMREKEEGEK